MKISVIIPSFNATDKIGRCFASLRAINMAREDYEVLFVDDCSSDGTHELTQKACSAEPNWRALRLENNSGSPSRPRNFGIDAAKGDYLYFLDCDDELLPDALTQLLELAQRTNACIIRSELLADNGRERKRMNQIPAWNGSNTVNERRELIITRTSTVPTSFVKRSLLQLHGIRWPEHLRMGEDSVFLAEVLVNAVHIEYLPEPTYIYYKIPSLTPASTQRYGKRELLDHVQVWTAVQSLLKPLGINYLEGRLAVGLRVALESLIFRNKGDIDTSCLEVFHAFVCKEWETISNVKWRKRHSDILHAAKNNDSEAFRRHCRPRLLIAGHDLKFIRDAVPELEEFFDIRFDEWKGHEIHDEKHSRAMLEWAEYIWCEWLLKNAEWYATNKKPYQRLVVRMHRMELSRSHGEYMNMANVDAVIAVSPLFFERLLERYPNIPRHKARMIPNYVRFDEYKTEWHPDRLYTLGMIGILPSRKGLRRALEILHALHSTDKRFRLEVFGRRPEELPWIARDTKEMDYFRECEQFIKNNGLTEAVNFNGHVDIKQALADRRVGYVLSMSDSEFDFPGFESFHLAVADSFAAHGLSVVRRWPGAEYLWNDEYLANEIKDAVDFIVKCSANSDIFKSSTLKGRRLVESFYPLEIFKKSIVGLYNELI
ncbi:glycosyltransferase [Comamonas sp. C11]|uniref:glycosyltransferase n=1 Tax=Comamonas sp. C11 TaxID=2966554 RepID=UPI002111A167|nr:glycosyltransferase [Comamonas sp. C11]UUC91698.1 glycosyltransferase [Comamonas sp. C11]